MIPEIKRARLIDLRRLELHWNQEIQYGRCNDNYCVTINGEPLKLVSPNKADWAVGTVYQKDEKLTTLTFEKDIDLEHLKDMRVTVGGEICGIRGERPDKEREYSVEYDPFYKVFSKSRDGIIIKSSEGVDIHVQGRAIEIIDIMLSKLPEVAEVLRRYQAEVAIYGIHETAYSIPEHRGGYHSMPRHVEGFGGTVDGPVSSISEVNVMRFVQGERATTYKNEMILVHEFAHALHLIGLDYLEDKTLGNRVKQLHHDAKEAGKWPNTYAISNHEEYFATLSTIWFNVMEEGKEGAWDGTRGPVNTREELYVYDREAYELMKQLYPETKLPAPWDSTPDRYDITGNKRDVAKG
jgi:hypothetical protein